MAAGPDQSGSRGGGKDERGSKRAGSTTTPSDTPPKRDVARNLRLHHHIREESK